MGLFGKLFKKTVKTVTNSLENLTMECPICHIYAKYDIENDNFICPQCGLDIMEYDEDEEYEEYDEDDDIPEGCLACGGPYPHCTSSCKLFDD